MAFPTSVTTSQPIRTTATIVVTRPAATSATSPRSLLARLGIENRRLDQDARVNTPCASHAKRSFRFSSKALLLTCTRQWAVLGCQQMKLYVCWGTFPVPQPGGHPCANAYHALRDAG